MLDIPGIVEKMRADGFAVTTEESIEVHRALAEGLTYIEPSAPETVETLRLYFSEGMSDGRVENTGY